MTRFLARRLALGAFVMWLVTVLTFLLFFLDPSGPLAVARRIGGKAATPQALLNIEHRLGLNQPIIVQYWHFLWGGSHPGLLRGNLGYDYYYGVSVNHVIAQAFPITFSLALGASILWLSMGLISGVISAVRPRTFIDRFFTTIALFFYSMPTFVLGLLLLLFFFYDLSKAGLHWFPAVGYVPFTTNPFEWARHLILPWFTLAVVSAAAYTRLSRSSMLDVLGEDYIRTARSKGLGERRVVLRHGLRAGLTPIVTQFGIDVGRTDRRCRHHRDGVQPAGSRVHRGSGDHERRPAGHPRHRHRCVRRGRAREHRGRHPVRDPRPAGPPDLTVGPAAHGRRPDRLAHWNGKAPRRVRSVL